MLPYSVSRLRARAIPTSVLIVLLIWDGSNTACLGQRGKYLPKLHVSQPTRLDWMFPFLRHSPAQEPAGILQGYASKRQTYEFYGPVRSDTEPLPLVLFVSPQDSAVGWPFFQSVCRGRGILFAGPHNAGNGHSLQERIRVTLDVLDDVRRRYRVDPDRTYLAGFSGGAAVATTTACHLPEYFGGVICVGSDMMLPREPWLLDRTVQRLSVALICGERESVGPRVALLHLPLLEAAGVSSRGRVVRGLRHAMPEPAILTSAVGWLEQELPRRRDLAKRHPASSIADAPSRADWAGSLLAEAKERTQDADEIAAAVAQLEGITRRWPDLPEAQAATDLVKEFQAQTDRPSEVRRSERRRRMKVARAHGYEQLALASPRRVRKSDRSQYAKSALNLWQELLDETGRAAEDFPPNHEARIEALAEIAARDTETRSVTISLEDARFDLVGQMSAGEALRRIRQTLIGLGYVVDVSLDGKVEQELPTTLSLNLRAVGFKQLAQTVLDPIGLKYRKRGNSIWIEKESDE